MIRSDAIKFNMLYLTLIVIHLVFVVAFPKGETNTKLEEEKSISQKIEFLKLRQKGCSQAVFIYGEKELNCTISIWYTGAFPMWMMRNDVIIDLKKATEQELRSLPVQLCSCKKVQVSDLCPADARGIPAILLHSCNDFLENSTGVPVDGVIAEIIKMVDDVKKLENVSVVLDHTTKSGIKDGENVGKDDENVGKYDEKVGKDNENVGKDDENLGKDDENVEPTEAKIVTKVAVEDNSKKALRYKFLDVDELETKTKEVTKDIKSKDNDEDDLSKDDEIIDNENKGDDDAIKNRDDSKQNVENDGESKRIAAPKTSTTQKGFEDKIKKINDRINVKTSEDDDATVAAAAAADDDDDDDDKKSEDKKDDVKKAEEELKKDEMSEKDKRNNDEVKNTGSTDDDVVTVERKTDNKDETKEEIKGKTIKNDEAKEKNIGEGKKVKEELKTEDKKEEDGDDDDDAKTKAAWPEDDDIESKNSKDEIEVQTSEMEDSSYGDTDDDLI